MGKIEDNSAAENAEQIEVQAGRRAPYTQVGDWVLLAPVSRQAKLLFWALSAHVNTTRGDTEVWPTQSMLAELMDFAPIKDDPAELRDGRRVRPFLKELVDIDAISVRKVRSRGRMRERSIYVINMTPPPDYDGLTSLQEFYTRRKERIAAAEAAEEAARGVQGELELLPDSTPKPQRKRPSKRRSAA